MLIGDSVSDVQPARGQAISIAVTTGRNSAVDLRSAGAAVVLDDLTGVVAAIRAAVRGTSAAS